MRRPRILLADDHTLVLEGFRKLLDPRYDIVGSVENGRDLIRAALRLRPDLILVDISMPLLNGIEAVRQLRQALPDVKVLFLTMHTNPAYVSEAFSAGASGYLLKRSLASELLTAVKEVLRGRFYVTPSVAKDLSGLPPLGGSLCESPVKGLVAGLTPRQREVLQLVAEGHTSKEIAQLLCVSVKTVEFHRSRLMSHLGLRSTAELTRYALEMGITGL